MTKEMIMDNTGKKLSKKQNKNWKRIWTCRGETDFLHIHRNQWDSRMCVWDKLELLS